jgi:AcrR family transcriptional regulator
VGGGEFSTPLDGEARRFILLTGQLINGAAGPMSESETTDSRAPSDAPRWQRRPEARPEEILDAAFTVFGENGYARTKLDEVAHRAGVSKGTLYLYFESKEALFQAMVRDRILPAVVQGEELLRTHQGSARDLLALFMRNMWTRMRAQEVCRIGRLVQSELGNFPDLAQFYTDEVILRSRRLLAAVIQRGVDRGEFRPLAADTVARLVSSLLVHSAQMQVFFAPFEPAALTDDQVLEGAIDLVLHGVLAAPAAPSKD